eukprot:gene14021-biopygen6580
MGCGSLYRPPLRWTAEGRGRRKRRRGTATAKQARDEVAEAKGDQRGDDGEGEERRRRQGSFVRRERRRRDRACSAVTHRLTMRARARSRQAPERRMRRGFAVVTMHEPVRSRWAMEPHNKAARLQTRNVV